MKGSTRGRRGLGRHSQQVGTAPAGRLSSLARWYCRPLDPLASLTGSRSPANAQVSRVWGRVKARADTRPSTRRALGTRLVAAPPSTSRPARPFASGLKPSARLDRAAMDVQHRLLASLQRASGGGDGGRVWGQAAGDGWSPSGTPRAAIVLEALYRCAAAKLRLARAAGSTSRLLNTPHTLCVDQISPPSDPCGLGVPSDPALCSAAAAGWAPPGRL